MISKTDLTDVPSVWAALRSSLSLKLNGLLMLLLLASLLVLGRVALQNGAAALLESETAALEAIRVSKQLFIERYFEII